MGFACRLVVWWSTLSRAEKKTAVRGVCAIIAALWVKWVRRGLRLMNYQTPSESNGKLLRRRKQSFKQVRCGVHGRHDYPAHDCCSPAHRSRMSDMAAWLLSLLLSTSDWHLGKPFAETPSVHREPL